jgi:hypothetical protein
MNIGKEEDKARPRAGERALPSGTQKRHQLDPSEPRSRRRAGGKRLGHASRRPGADRDLPPDRPRRPDPFPGHAAMNGEVVRRKKIWLYVFLLLLTLLMTSAAAAYQNGVGLSAMIADPSEIAAGFFFSLKLIMMMLLIYAWLKSP